MLMKHKKDVLLVQPCLIGSLYNALALCFVNNYYYILSSASFKTF